MSEQGQEPIPQKACQRHGHAKGFRSGKGQAYIFMSQWCCEPGRLEPLLGNQGAVDLINRCGEKRRGQKIDILASIYAGLADERHGLAQRLARAGRLPWDRAAGVFARNRW